MPDDIQANATPSPSDAQPASAGDNSGVTTPESDTTGISDKSPESIPYARFAEVNQKRKEAETRLAELEASRKAAEEQAAEEQGKFKELAEQRKARAEYADKLEETLNGVLEKEIQGIPEDRRSLIPESLSVSDKLSYISNNRAFLTDVGNKAVGQPSSPDMAGTGKVFKSSQLNDASFVRKNREEITKAIAEGRVIED